ncbi:hypothetical protein J3A83DRAFT_4097127 [Scleroderma citrinum]
MFGVGMGGAPALKGLNSGWQVWGSGTPGSKRNASISSAASVNDLSPSQAENGFRGNIGESWSAPRASSGTWDELSGSPQKKEFPQLVMETKDPNSPLSLHHTRQRQATAAQVATLSGPRMDDRGSAKTGQFSPQRFDHGLGKDGRYSATSPSHPGAYGSARFPGQNGGFDSIQVSSMVDNELSLGLRGMAVEDDQVNGQYRQQHPPAQATSVSHSSTIIPQVRTHPQVIQGRAPYPGYAQTDYSSYYTNGAARDPYMEYGYGYSAPQDPSLYSSSNGMNNTSAPSIYPAVSSQPLHASASAAQQSGVYFDYSGPGRSPSQFYYPPHQAMMYATIPPISPMPTPQLSAAVPAAMQDKKQVRIYVNFIHLSAHLRDSLIYTNR